MRRILLGLVVLVAAGIGGSSFLGKVSRADLGITPANSGATQCLAPQLADLRAVVPAGSEEGCTEPGGCASKERISAAFLPYAIASLNAYGGTGRRAGDLAKLDPSWRVKREPVHLPNGFGYVVFTREHQGEHHVLVAFRGTDTMGGEGFFALFPSLPDAIANASWFTQWFNPSDQYKSARDLFAEIRREAFREAAGRVVRFHVTGHSLGGGLAQHVARGFPCTSAVVFNSSCVVNRVRFAEPYMNNQIVDIRENRDWLTGGLCAPAALWGWGSQHQVYDGDWIGDRARNNSDEMEVFLRQHYIGNMAFGMGRTILCCAQNQRRSTHDSCGCHPAVLGSVEGARRMLCQTRRENRAEGAQRRAASADATPPATRAPRGVDPCDFSPIEKTDRQCRRSC